jgi:hypothetical protein
LDKYHHSMKKSIAVLTLVIVIVACKKELVPQESTVSFTTTPSTPTNNQNQAASTSNQSTMLSSGSNTQQKVNPPHGQPGHVCGTQDQPQTIPVQQQNQSNQQYSISQPVANAKNNISTPVKVAKGMNPPHGQPGHRCDIAVGQPLNSKPKTTTTQTTTTPVVSTTNNNSIPAVLAPNTTNATPAPVKTEPGMNPPHGQPGHVCGIAVGSPLNQEKKTEEKKEETPK